MSQLKRISIGAAALALIVETGAKNLLLWTFVTIGTPALTAAFVMQVVELRRSHFQAGPANDGGAGPGAGDASVAILDQDSRAPGRFLAADAVTAMDLRRRLTSMLVARANFVDLYGTSPTGLSPIQKQVALNMLDDDGIMLARLAAEKRQDVDAYLLDLQQDEARLRVLHAQLATMVPLPKAAAVGTKL